MSIPVAARINTPTLSDLAAEINAALKQADSARLLAGRLLLEAREIFEASRGDGDSWRGWCATNIPARSYRDIKRVMALARSADPKAALVEEREKARRGMAANRARRNSDGTNVCPPEIVRVGKQTVDVSQWGDAAKAQIKAALGSTEASMALADCPEPNSQSRYTGVATARNRARWHGEGSDWASPPEVFGPLDDEFHFTLDAAASDWNGKCPRYFTEADDGLAQDWGSEVVWLSSPFGSALQQWVRKAYEASQAGATVVCLVPVSTDRPWWAEYAAKAEIRYLPGRPRFRTREGEWQELMRPSAILVFRPPKPAKKRYWLIPPKLRSHIDLTYKHPVDICPHPRPPGFDALSSEFEWPSNVLVHPLFVLADCDDDRHGPSAFARRAIRENQQGKQVVLLLPVPHPLNLLLQAGAQVVPIPADGEEVYEAGRVHWLDTETGEPMASPGPAALFVLEHQTRPENDDHEDGAREQATAARLDSDDHEPVQDVLKGEAQSGVRVSPTAVSEHHDSDQTIGRDHDWARPGYSLRRASTNKSVMRPPSNFALGSTSVSLRPARFRCTLGVAVGCQHVKACRKHRRCLQG